MNRKQGTQIQYDVWKLVASWMTPLTHGITAPPAIAIVSKEEPALVNFPKSAIASGQSAGHINEHPNAMKKIQYTDHIPGRIATSTEPINAIMAQNFMAAA